MAKQNWSQRRQKKLWIIWFVCGLFGAVVALAISRVHTWFAGDLGSAEALSEIEKKLGLFGFILDVPFIANAARASPDVVIGLFGFFIIGGLVGATRRVWLHDILWADFNDEVLIRIGATTQMDRKVSYDDIRTVQFVELDWDLGSPNGPRHKAWDSLMAWALKGALEREGRFGSPQKLLSLQVLSGRAGSGKSRMSYELARHLARRDVLGDSKRTSAKAKISWRIAAWLRRVILPIKQRPDDPWDAGLIPRDPRDQAKLIRPNTT
jgi:hypothetical protein